MNEIVAHAVPVALTDDPAPPGWLHSPGPWLQTQSGRAFDLLNPQPEQVALADIAASLCRLPRFNGQTLRTRDWSVGDHSMLVADIVAETGASATVQLAALLHDAHEAYIGDITTPVAVALRRTIELVCRVDFSPVHHIKVAIDRAIRLAFGLPVHLHPETEGLIHDADIEALRRERNHLMAPPPRPWAGGEPHDAQGGTAWYHRAGADEFSTLALHLLARRHGTMVPAIVA